MKTPETAQPFNSIRFVGNDGIFPAAKPTTRYVPPQPIDLKAGSAKQSPIGS